MALRIEPLGKQHERGGFTCGQPELDDWFRKRAGQDERRNVARVFVAVDDELGPVGFYSLGAFTLTFERLPDEIACKLPRYDAIPAALIGRLARDEKGPWPRDRRIAAGRCAVRRILGASKALAVFAIVVDAKDVRAVQFYAAFGFRVFPLQPSRLFLLASSAAAGYREDPSLCRATGRGMISSTLLTLVVIPAIYALVKDRQLGSMTRSEHAFEPDGRGQYHRGPIGTA